jgi:hypothetical protein
MTDNFVVLPNSILESFSNLKNTSYVAYSSCGKMDCKKISKQIGIETDSEMCVRAHPKVVDETIRAVTKFDTCKVLCDDAHYGYDYKTINILLKILKIPNDLLDDNILKFISKYDEEEEKLCFNIYKLYFNSDNTYSIKNLS